MLLSDRLAAVLSRQAISFTREPSLAGIQPDFLVAEPTGRTIVLEVKAWEPTDANQQRASQQADFYKEATGADEAYVVLPNLEGSSRSTGVLSVSDVLDLLRERRMTGPIRQRRPTEDRPLIFAAMPFDERYDDVFQVAMTHSARAVRATCKRIDELEFSGDVVAVMKQKIRASVAVIADLSEAKPNVMYEVGFAHAADVPVVPICSTSVDELPFNVGTGKRLSMSRVEQRDSADR